MTQVRTNPVPSVLSVSRCVGFGWTRVLTHLLVTPAAWGQRQVAAPALYPFRSRMLSLDPPVTAFISRS